MSGVAVGVFVFLFLLVTVLGFAAARWRRAQALDGRAMGKWLLRHPFLTLGVIARIHWQALRLAAKRVSFHRKPAPPLEETT